MKSFFKLFSLFLITWIFTVACSVGNSNQKTVKPNVLLIVVDDLNDYEGIFGGHPQARTPNIDKLAASGVRFVNAQTNIGHCLPSRNSFFTGVYPHQSRNFGLDQPTTTQLYQNNKTLMELFSENGYYVMGSGKLLHNNQPKLWNEWGVNVNNYGPLAYDGEKPVGHPSVPQPFRSIGDIDGSFAPLSDVPVFIKDEVKGPNPGWSYSGNADTPFRYIDENNRDLLPDELHAQWASRRIKEMDESGTDQPFFMGVGFVRPHTPLYAPKRFFDMFPLEKLQLPVIKENDVEDTHYKDNYPIARSKDGKWYTNTSKGPMYSKLLTESYGGDEAEGLKHFLQAYLACVAFADEQVGKVLDALENSRFKDNTIVILTSDHGWQMGQKQYLFKNSPWENATHVPLVIRAPGARANNKVSHPVALIDIYPTLMDFCSLSGDNRKNEKGFEPGGFSLKSFLNNPEMQDWNGPEGTLTAIATDSVAYEFSAQTFSYRTIVWRYIMYPNGQEELYDLKADPHEWNNLEADKNYEAIKSELRKKVMEMIHQ